MHPFRSKYAAASSESLTFPYWPAPTIKRLAPSSYTCLASSREMVCDVPYIRLESFFFRFLTFPPSRRITSCSNTDPSMVIEPNRVRSILGFMGDPPSSACRSPPGRAARSPFLRARGGWPQRPRTRRRHEATSPRRRRESGPGPGPGSTLQHVVLQGQETAPPPSQHDSEVRSCRVSLVLTVGRRCFYLWPVESL